MSTFGDRGEAGRVLAELLRSYRDRDDVLVLGLARGGAAVGWEVASALGAPLDVMVVRKLGVPGSEELAMGAIASGGRIVVNDDVVEMQSISTDQWSAMLAREVDELARREARYRGGRPPADITGKTVILVDDGMATGASMLVAGHAVRDGGCRQVVVAVPVAPKSSFRRFATVADDIVCASMPSPFRAVGESFRDFRQVTDDQVCRLLADHRGQSPSVK